MIRTWRQRFRAWAQPNIPVLQGRELSTRSMLVEKVEGGWLIGKKLFAEDLWPGANLRPGGWWTPAQFQYATVVPGWRDQLTGARRWHEDYVEFWWLS